MSRARSVIEIIGAVILGTSLAPLHGQAPNPAMAQQLRSQYGLTRVGINGMTIGQAGSVLVMQEDGLVAIPAAFGKYWYNNSKKGAPIKANAIQHVGTAYGDAMAARRLIQVGERMYLTNLEFAPTEIVFYVQSCGACDSAASDPNNPPYRARLAFQFEKGYLSAADPKQVLEITGRVFGLDSGPPSGPQAQQQQPLPPQQQPPPGPAEPAAPAAAPAASDAAVLQNQDIIKMMKAGFDDTVIIAKISVSKCRFDTSTDALIQLKENGVSAAVLKAMVGAPK